MLRISSKTMANTSINVELEHCSSPEKHAKLSDVVKILIQNHILVKSWSQFYDTLGCQFHEKQKWQLGFAEGAVSPYKLFSEILKSWISRSPNRTIENVNDVLREMDCVEVAGKLEEVFGKNSVIRHFLSGKKQIKRRHNKADSKRLGRSDEKMMPISFGLMETTSNFSGREDELQKLNSHFLSNETNLILVCGLGGIGKTELCKKFANDIYAKNISCVWLRGESMETLHDSISQLSEKLGVTNEENLNSSEYFGYLASIILESCSRLLVIIDDVGVNYDEAIKGIKTIVMAKYARQIFVIATSRYRNALHGAGITIFIDILDKAQSRIMLQGSLIALTDSDTDKLCKLLQYFPLALQQAIAYIKQQRNHFRTRNYSILDYVNEFEMRKIQMLGQMLNELHFDYSMTTLVTWDMIIAKLSTTSIEILNILAHLEPDAIPLNFLNLICKEKGLCDFDASLDLIDNYSLAKIEGPFVSIQRSNQEIVLRKLQNPQDYSKSLFDCVLLACREFFKGGPSRTELCHLNSVCRLAWKYEIGKIKHFYEALQFLLYHARIDCAVKFTMLHFKSIQFSINEAEKRELLDKILLWAIVSNGDYDFVTNENIENGEYPCRNSLNLVPYNMLEKCLEISQMYYGEESSITFRVKNELAMSLCAQGENNKALKLCEDLAKHFPLQNKDQETEYFGTIRYLVNQLGKVEDFELQIKQLERIDKIIARFGKIQPDRFLTREVCTKFGNFEENAKLTMKQLEKILCFYKSILGDNDKLTLRVKNEMAKEMCVKRKYEASISLIEQVIRANSDNGEITTAYDTMQDISECLFYDENYQQSKELLERVLQFRVRVLGENHKDTVWTKEVYARVLEKLGEFGRALELQIQRLHYYESKTTRFGWVLDAIKAKIYVLENTILNT